MNRPKKSNLEEIRFIICSDNTVRNVKNAYIFEMEKYCDELEARIAHLNEFIDDRQEETIGIIEKYEELIDKICSFNAICNLTNWGELRKGFTTKEEWKEWLMKDE